MPKMLTKMYIDAATRRVLFGADGGILYTLSIQSQS